MVSLRPSRRLFLAASLLGVLILAGIPHAQAAVVLELSLQQLARSADRVVVGTPWEAQSQWERIDGSGSRIATYRRVRIESDVVGGGSSEVWIRTLGGRVGKVAQRVEGEAVLSHGERHLMFLATRPDGTHTVMGMAQGAYPVVRGKDKIDRVAPARSPGIVVPLRSASPKVGELVGGSLDRARQMILAARKRHDG